MNTGQTAQVEIQDVSNNGNPVYENTPPGKNYTVREWECSGTIDGNYQQSFRVKTLSGKVKAYPGFSFTAELDNFQNRVSYKIPTPKQDDWQGGGSGRQEGVKSGAQGVQTGNGGSGRYTLEEYQALFVHSYSFIMENFCKNGDERAKYLPLVATYLISAIDMGLKPVSSQTQASHPADFTPQDPTIKVIEEILTKGGLLRRVAEARYTDDQLKQWYTECGGSPNTFMVNINKQLGAAQPDEGGDLPF